MGTDQESSEALRAKITRLEARVAELEQLLAARSPARAGPPEGSPDPDRDGAREGARFRDEDVPYKVIFDALPMAVMIFTADGTLAAINDFNCRRFKTTRERVVGKFNVFEDPRAVEAGYIPYVQRALGGEVVKLPPTFYETQEGPMFPGGRTQIWSEPTYLPIKDESGVVRFILVVSVDITANKLAEAAQRRSAALLEAVIDNAPLLVYASDAEGRFTIVNTRTAAFFGRDRAGILGKTVHEFLPAEVADRLREQDRETMAAEGPVTFEDHVTEPDGPHVYMTTKFALRDEEGKATGVCGISMDITERVRAEERSRQLQERLLQVQEEVIRALSTPLLPIAEGVVVMPLVGEVTRDRAAQMIETLLAGVVNQQARIAILDVTGVPQAAGMDVIDAVLRAARSVRLLGAEVVLTGIRPSVAQALVEVGADLGGVVTLSTLERGVAYALAALAQRGAYASRAPVRRPAR